MAPLPPFKVGITLHSTFEDAERQAQAQAGAKGRTDPAIIFKDGEPHAVVERDGVDFRTVKV